MGSINLDRYKDPISLALVQKALKNSGIFGLLLRSTDKYFNEYVPKNQNLRAKITGFDGSVGDALITQKSAHLFVDGRYVLQAKNQAKDYSVHVCQNALTIESTLLATLDTVLPKDCVLAYDPRTIDIYQFGRLAEKVGSLSATLSPNAEKIFAALFPPQTDEPTALQVFTMDEDIVGQSREQKLSLITAQLKAKQVDGFLIVKLDDIAWLTNFRSYAQPFSSSMPAIACILDGKLLLGCSLAQTYADKNLEIVTEDEFFQTLKSRLKAHNTIFGIDSKETSKAHELALRALDIEIKAMDNPIVAFKAIKNEKELQHMRVAFKKADHVVYQTSQFVVESITKQQTISEADVDDHIKNGFTLSGAKALSFRPICAAGKNGAVIHYGHPDRNHKIEEGSLFLLDTGAYYEGGYATDLTRTFLAAPAHVSAKPWQKEMFTLVLKASIRGLSARLKRGSLGTQLDAIVRQPLWQAGLDFAHGTGHGVGINVHEFPPRIGPGSTTPLLEGQVFSIEPGLYFENLGGVRIENLVTVVADPEHKDFIRILPLTFSPLDERLIEMSMLDAHDKEFLAYCEKEWQSTKPLPSLPPLKSVQFS